MKLKKIKPLSTIKRIHPRFLSLVCILCIAFFFRSYKITSVPPSPSLDEVSIGWNAYSILKTGKDEYGSFLPLALRAYDDYRPALYVYLTIPFTALLGLSVLSIRLPSVLLSCIAVLGTYYVANYLFYDEKNKRNVTLGHISAFLLAVSPWHIYLSRLGHEVNLGLTTLIVGFVFFLHFVRKDTVRSLILAAIFFAISFGSYQSEKVIVPLLVFTAAILYCSQLRLRVRYVMIAGIVGLLLSLPTLFVTFSSTGLLRLSGTSAFSTETLDAQRDLTSYSIAREQGNVFAKLWYSPRVRNVRIFISNYTKHFQPEWLTSGGPMDSHKVPFTGVLYPWEFILAILGIVFLCIKRSRESMLILSWLLIGPLPAAITTQAPHAMRSFTMVPAWQILAGIFLYWLLTKKNSFIRWGSIFMFLVAFIVTVPGMFERYLTLFPSLQSESFGYSVTQSLQFIRDRTTPSTPLVINPIYENNGIYFQTYMFALFTLRVDPAWYLSHGGTKGGGLGQEFTVGSIAFRKIPKDTLTPGTIYLGNKSDFDSSRHILYTSHSVNGMEGMQVVTGSL